MNNNQIGYSYPNLDPNKRSRFQFENKFVYPKFANDDGNRTTKNYNAATAYQEQYCQGNAFKKKLK